MTLTAVWRFLTGSNRVYFDYAATTPLDKRVAQAMQPFQEEVFGNPSSLHWAGREARQALVHARQQMADLLNARSEEIIFTGSGTESSNMALRCVFEAMGERENHLITSAIEHPSVLETCRYLERQGVDLTYLPVDENGLVNPSDLINTTDNTVSLDHGCEQRRGHVATDRRIKRHCPPAISTS